MNGMKEKTDIKSALSYIFIKNPILVLGLVIGQLAAGDTNLQNGAALSVTFLFVSVPVIVFASAFGKKLPAWTKPVCYALLAAVMLVPAYFISGTFSATIFDSAGIYPAILAVSTVPIVFSNKIAEKMRPSDAFITGLCVFAGFALTALFLGAFREFFGNGSLWGIRILEKGTFPSLRLPFWGFIILGFMAAAVNFIKDILGKPGENFSGEEGN